MKKEVKSQPTVIIRRERRYFTEAARKSIVEEVERGLSKAEAARKYEVSQEAIYKWIRAYSKRYSPLLIKVVEHKSESNRYKALERELEMLYAKLGRASAEIDFLNGVIDKAGAHYEVDLKKNFDVASCSTTIKSKKRRG